MTIDELLDRLWMGDAEVFAHDSLFVFEKYNTEDEVVFHNSTSDEINEWLLKTKPILCMYNGKSYDKYILQAWLAGCTPEEIKEVNDFIIDGHNGWELNLPHVDLPTIWDPFNEITPKKSLKELEGNLRLDITETTIPFDLPTKWTKQQYEEVLYYCRHDVKALKHIFNALLNKYKSKFIIAKIGNIDPEFALSQTDANLTAILLGAERQEHEDNFDYKYPDVVDKSKIPQDFLDYIDDMIEKNDLNYSPKAPLLDLDTIECQTGYGGIHGFVKQGGIYYDRGDVFECE